MNQTFLEVQRALFAALHHRDFDHVIEDSKAFYIMTMENGLSGLIFSVLDKDRTHPELFQRLQRNHYDYIARDVKQIEAIKTIDQLLNQHHIDHLFMKGSILKFIYPETYMRAMGDIDVLIKEGTLQQVHELFKELNIVCTSHSKQHDVFEMPNGVVCEVHPMLYKPFNDHYQMIGEVWNHVHLEEEHRYRMNPEFELIYLMYHLAKHMEAGGIGLRSILDIGLYTKKYEDIIDEQRFNEFVQRMNMQTFMHTMLAFSEKAFGIRTKLTNDILLDDETYEELINYLSVSGIHGIGRKHNAMASRVVTYKRKKQSRFKVWMDILFPNLETMIGIYPWLKRAKILLPIAWFIRWIKIMVKRPKQSLKKVKQLQIDDEVIIKRQTFFEKIGL